MEEKLNIIRELTWEPINELGYDLYHLEFVSEEGEDYLRFYIDTRTDEAVTLEDCEKVSRRVSVLLDEKDPIDSAYFLEVSSPGLFRELHTADHIKGALGERVRVQPVAGGRAGRDLVGTLTQFDGSMLTLDVDGKTKEIKMQDLRAINLEPEV